MSDSRPVQPFARHSGADPVAIPLPFGDLLRRLRRAAGLSQEALAERATLSWRTISDIERGIKRKPQQETFRLLMDALALSQEDRALLEAALRGPGKVAPLATLAAPTAAPTPVRADIPVPMTPLIGRTREIAAVCTLVRNDAVRLLTITGPGGVGKTRLAIAVATDLMPDFADDVCFVPLAPIQDPTLLFSTITQTLGIRERTGDSTRETLFDHLRDKRFLLILDNFEQLTAAAASVAAMLAACPRLIILVTSRAALHVYGEQEYAVGPLPLPNWNGKGDPVTIGRSAAVELFRQRAAAIRPGFVLSSANAATVAEICVRLDGLPLAIELAVARVKIFPPADMLAHLRSANGGSSLALLTDGPQDAPTRQRTMRDAIAWSYDLLDANEQALFRRLAVFAGGCTLEAASEVCGPDADLPQVYDGIAALIDQSLVQTREGMNDDTRFAMLGTIHEFATELLAAHGETALLRQQHAGYFLTFAEIAGSGLFGPDQAHWLGCIDADHENLRAALTWARDEDAHDIGLRIAAALAQFWHVRGYLAEGRRWLESFLARTPSDPADSAALPRARALEGLATIATRQGETALVDACSMESLAIYRRIGDRRGIARALHSLGRAALVRTDYPRAITYYVESLAIRRAINDRRGIAETLTNLGRLVRFQGDYARAETLLGEAIPLWRQERDALGLAMALGNLGHMARDRGEPAVATPYIEESFTLYQDLKNTRGISIVLNQRALLAYDAGAYDRARALSEESLALREQIGDEWGIADCHRTLGDIAAATGNPDDALAHYRAGLPHFRKVGTLIGVAECLERVARMMSERGASASAARLFGAADAFRDETNSPVLPVDRPAYDRAVATARAALGDDAYAHAWEAGHDFPPVEAIAEALASD